MPKLPKSVSRSRTQSEAPKKPARGSKGNGKATKKAAAATLDPPSFEHRQIDQAAASNGGGMTATVELNEFERGLLSDLFAVIEEHTRDADDQVDRVLI